jgi:hypothetical protein
VDLFQSRRTGTACDPLRGQMSNVTE